MNRLGASPENVFQPEYWSPRTVPDLVPHNIVKTSREATGDDVENLCSRAAGYILTNEAREAVPEGTALDYESDNQYTQPGSVLLTDMEVLLEAPSKRDRTWHPRTSYEDEPPLQRRRQMTDASELTASAASLFQRNAEVLPLIPDKGRGIEEPGELNIVWPYERVLHHPQFSVMYARIVGLLVFDYGKEGGTIGYVQKQWLVDDGEQVAGGMANRLTGQSKAPHIPVTIGESYQVPKDSKIAFGSSWNIHAKSKLTIRIRSAEQCLQGALQYSPAKNTKRRGILVPKLGFGSSSA